MIVGSSATRWQASLLRPLLYVIFAKNIHVFRQVNLQRLKQKAVKHGLFIASHSNFCRAWQ